MSLLRDLVIVLGAFTVVLLVRRHPEHYEGVRWGRTIVLILLVLLVGLPLLAWFTLGINIYSPKLPK